MKKMGLCVVLQAKVFWMHNLHIHIYKNLCSVPSQVGGLLKQEAAASASIFLSLLTMQKHPAD